jgi:cytochrome c-type protein NapC
MAERGNDLSTLQRVGLYLFRPSSMPLTALVAIGAVVGMVYWGAFNAGMDATNSLEFCTSCHEMRENVHAEYQETIHFKNRSGVRATCPDCHVPKDWMHKFVRKIKASGELYVKFVSQDIDTPEKFERKRHELAKRVWASMKESDSRECRNCHTWEAMDHNKQPRRAVKAMEEGRKAGKTCIDCHKGVAHLLPADYDGDADPDRN